MLQIIIWMLCVYFIIKAGELWLIASASPEDRRTRNQWVAAGWGLVCLFAAIAFFVMSVEQASEMPSSTLPSALPY